MTWLLRTVFGSAISGLRAAMREEIRTTAEACTASMPEPNRFDVLAFSDLLTERIDARITSYLEG